MARELALLGHEVTAFTSAGEYDGAGSQATKDERVWVERVWTPAGIPRSMAWLLFALQAGRRISAMEWDVCILMTDPPLLPWLAGRMRNRIGAARKIVVWLMDLYPEALVASGRLKKNSIIYRALWKRRQCSLSLADLLVCLGEAQKERLGDLAEKVRCEVVSPWDGREEVARLDESQLKSLALYAGNLGEAHDYRQLLKAAPYLRDGWQMRFAVRGAKENALRHDAEGKKSVEVTGYVSENETPQLLASARVHLITMTSGWEGVVVPSKLYGCVRTGRPILFLGPERSDTAIEIRERGWGEVLSPGADGETIARAIQRLGRLPTKDWALGNGARDFARLVEQLA